MVNVKKVRNFGAHSPIWDVFLKSFPELKAQGTMWKRVWKGKEQEVVDDSQRAASSRHTRANVINTHRDWQHV